MVWLEYLTVLDVSQDGMALSAVVWVNQEYKEAGRMTYVVRRDNESSESLIKRFRRKVSRDRILSELRKRRYFVTKGEEGRIAKRKGISRARRKARKRREKASRY